MADTLTLSVLTPAGEIFNGEVREVVVPTTAGDLGIFRNHTPLTTVAKLGVVNIRKEASDTTFDHIVISSGIVEVDQDSVRLLVDDAAHVDSIDELKEREAQMAAEQAKQAATTDEEIAAAEASVARATAWLGAAKLRK